MEDHDLVARSQRGDGQAFTLLVRRHERSLYATAYAITRSQWDAADAMQDALATAHAKIRTLRDPDRFGAWVSKILVNRCNAVIRSRRRTVPVAELPEPTVFVWDGPEDGMDLMDAIHQLSPEHRQVIALRYFRDLKVDEIARLLGCPVGTVKSRINRALGALHAGLDRPTAQEVWR